MNPNQPNSLTGYQIVVGDKAKVIKDKRTKTRVANFPFEFPDGTNGVLILCRVKDEEWVPSKEINSIIINYV
jgi:hypothetical protein